MKINNKIFSLFVLIFGLATLAMVILYFLHKVGIDSVMLFLGFTELFLGLNNINLTKSVDFKGNTRSIKLIGLFCIVLGLGIIISVIIKTYA